MYPQFPGAGIVAAPSPLVSPLAVSSLADVKMMGWLAVPAALRIAGELPRPIVRVVPVWNLTTTPGSRVSVIGVLVVP